jgi:GWxTD domain-containing protein
LKRGAWGWLAVLVGLSAFTYRSVAADSPLESRIKTLSSQVKRPGTPDSLRYELAMALAETGTIEGRYQALVYLRQIRRTYDGSAGYHRDIARIFIDSQQPSRAVSALEEVVRLEPGDVDARVLIARLLLDELLYHYDLRNTGRMMTWLDSARALDPTHRDALFLSSLAMELAASRPEAPADLSERGKGFALDILRAKPDDVAARLLLAIHELDLGRPAAAREAFQAALESGPPEVREAFHALDWTANDRALDRARQMDVETKAEFSAVYWILQDPSPITLVNENQLEIWKRLAMSEFLLGRPDEGLRGWQVPAGEAYIRYGPPTAHDFDPGEIQGQSGARDTGGINLIPPAWTWTYRFRDVTFTLRFEDKSLNGNFIMDSATMAQMDILRKRAPVVYGDATPGRIRYLYLASDGVAGPTRLAKQQVHLAVPLWRKSTELADMEKVSVEIRVENVNRSVVRHARRLVTYDDIVAPAEGLNMLLVSNEFTLGPGRYKATAFVNDPERKVHGVYSIPFEVRDYKNEPGLVISDLALSFRLSRGTARPFQRTLGEAHLPNPMGLVGDERNLQVFYEMYGLKASGGAAVQEARYTIVPRALLLDYEARLETGEVRVDLMTYTAAALDAGAYDLGTDNFLDARFPPAPVEVSGGRAQKATRLALGTLAPGEYAFVATVRDVNSGLEGSARTFFRILADDQFRGLFGE